MFKHTIKILASIFILAGITLFISCQEEPTLVTPDEGQRNLSKVSTFVMPVGATLVSANLKIFTWNTTGNPHNIGIHKITEDWSCPVTWNSFNNAYNPVAITTFNMSGGGSHWNTIDITATVQAWLNGESNYGLFLKHVTDALGQFLSNEWSDPALRPYLEIVTTAGTIEVEPLYDTYIQSIDPDNSYCDEEKLYVGLVEFPTYSIHKHILIRFDIEPQIDCAECEGKVSQLTLQYNGGSNAQIKVVQKKNNVVVFDAMVAAGGQFTFNGTDNGTLGT